MTATSADRVTLPNFGELIAAIPHLLGFYPVNSVVVVIMHGRRVGLAIRADLVAAEHVPALGEQLRVPVAAQQPTGVVLVVVGDGGSPSVDERADEDFPPPHEPALHALADALQDEGIVAHHAAWVAATVAGARWRCYWEADCHGTVPDPTTSTLAAASVGAGLVTFGSREELERSLEPAEPRAVARRARRIMTAIEDHPGDETAAREGWQLLHRLYDAAVAHSLVLDDDTVIGAAATLSDPNMRDAALIWSVGDCPDAAERLWLALTRETPPPARAQPAILLAMTAYVLGNGALTGLALDIVFQACPEDGAATLLRTALDTGIGPGQLAALVADVAVDARIELFDSSHDVD